MTSSLFAFALVAASGQLTGHVMVAPLPSKTGDPSNVALSIELVPARGWHTYWQNPGDAGSPTTIQWKLPKDWKVKSLLFPAPDRIVTAGIVCYGYEKPATLIATLTPPPGFKAGSAVPIQGEVKWLTCTAEVCKPASGAFQTMIKIPASATTPWPAADLYPHSAPGWKTSASLTGKSINLKIVTPGSPLAGPGVPYFFSSDAAVLAHDKAQDFSFAAGLITATLPVSQYANHPPKRLRGVLRAPAGMKWSNGFSSISIDVPIS